MAALDSISRAGRLSLVRAVVAVTGLGQVTAFGRGAAAALSGLADGDGAVTPLSVPGFDRAVLFGQVPEPAIAVERAESDSDGLGPDVAPAMALAAARDALADAGWTATALAASGLRVVTVIGCSKGLVANLLAPGRAAGSPVESGGFAGFSGDHVARFVARRVGAGGGPALNPVAACATGLAALAVAARMLEDGEADVVLAGAAESSRHPLVLAGFHAMGVISDRPSRPFRPERDGFNPGEGAGVMVLERAADARARGARLVATVLGTELRADAHHPAAAEPGGAALRHTLRRVLARVQGGAGAVGLINAHATGTVANDAAEAAVLAEVFGTDRFLSGAGAGRDGTSIVLTGLKPLIGHLLGASAAAETVLSLMVARAGLAVGGAGLLDGEIMPAFSPAGDPAAVATDGSCVMLKLSLGFGGHVGVAAFQVHRG